MVNPHPYVNVSFLDHLTSYPSSSISHGLAQNQKFLAFEARAKALGHDRGLLVFRQLANMDTNMNQKYSGVKHVRQFQGSSNLQGPNGEHVAFTISAMTWA